jgi:trehalose/maltose transport system substrate-binding protein
MTSLRRKDAGLWCGRLDSKRIITLLLASLLYLSPACSKQASREPVTLTFLDVEWDTPDRLPELARDLQDFTQETGILVKRLPRPDGSLDQLALWRQQLEKGPAAPDLVSIDVIWSGMLSQYLMDLKPFFASELS